MAGRVRGCPVRPSYLRAHRVHGIVKMKHALELAYLQAEQKALLKSYAAAR